MKILVFTEGNIFMHSKAKDLLVLEVIKQVQDKEPNVDDFANYIPCPNSVEKLNSWSKFGAEISYLTSRKSQNEVSDIKNVLNKFGFPKGELFFRKEGESYKNVIEKFQPDVYVENDCKSIGSDEMAGPKLDQSLNIKVITLPEFAGLNTLPDNPKLL